MTSPTAVQPSLASLDAAPRAAAPARVMLVLIASAGHSGSTLLDVLLANHSHVSSAGEMNRLTLHAPDRVCACGATVTGCEHWNRIRATITEWRHDDRLIRWDECHTDLPPEKPVCHVPHADSLTLVDGGPAPLPLGERLREQGLTVSDGAVLARSGGRDFKWRLIDAETKRTDVVRRGGDDRLVGSCCARPLMRSKFLVKYDPLCETPGRELQRVCGFLGLAFEPGRLTLWQRPVHHTPGNAMLFNRARRAIVRDEPWRRDLTAAELEAFDRLAGKLNRSFGYR